tara:strand:- start:860 stop:1330 length:471 start_codon:yes stop_codon:yes gene_type:complete
MQTFLPYESFEQSAQVLDWRRLGKQRVEGMQIINAINNPTQKGWVNHPATVMWKPYVNALKHYTNIMIREWISRGYNNNMEFYSVDEMINDDMVEFPHWLGNKKFHASHRANLLRKDYEYYSQFGWDENPKKPYVWHDTKGLWYEQHIGTGQRIYL